MLILSRKKDQKIIIGDQKIVLTVVEIRGDRVRLGFEADKSIPIDREEVWVSKNAVSVPSDS